MLNVGVYILMKLKDILVICGLIAMVACSAPSGKIDAFAKYPPDEFAVSVKRPLVVPPIYELTQPNTQAQNNRQEISQTDIARQTVFGSNSNSNQEIIKTGLKKKGLSAAEVAFLEKADALSPKENIRAILLSENKNITTDASLADDLFFWRTEQDQDILEPNAENDRIFRAVTQGEGVDQGALIKKKQDEKGSGLLHQIPSPF